jgi:hypothetical protein
MLHPFISRTLVCLLILNLSACGVGADVKLRETAGFD